ncbi:hypothetical protein ACQP25_06045 [Microtetraspora malaysiensis]|uniref:hypothetical protein n=1 Tax=Microtetraspora malaysiensis TaxID=161358 RepID=UPI003D944C64
MLPTNLLFTVAGRPGALLRHRRRGHLGGSLTWLRVLGTIVALFIVTWIVALAVWRFATMRATAQSGSWHRRVGQELMARHITSCLALSCRGRASYS